MLMKLSQNLRERLNASCIAQVVLENAAAQPEKPAIVCDNQSVSYGDLADRIEAIAADLEGRGIGSGNLVGVLASRSPDLVAALLGINLCGAGYVPLDPSFPSGRLDYIVEDSGIRHVLHDAQPAIPGHAERVTRVDLAGIKPGQRSARSCVDPQSLAYSIYTSGSTGKPKGVLIQRNALHNFLASMVSRPGLGETDLWLAVTTPSFDIAVVELFLPLLVGGTVLLATEAERRDGLALSRMLTSQPVTVMQATPATWQMLIDADWEGSPALKALCGGEALSPQLAGHLLRRCGALWNMYGPTETTVWSSCKKIEKLDTGPVSAGSPIDNTYLRILDKDLKPVPDGAEGELFIGGDGVALGYSSPELTARQFLQDPFAPAGSDQRLYRTGDRAFVRNGELFIEGRMDAQIKVRGYRVEPSEIEAALNNLQTVRQSVVVQVRQPDGRTLLCAAVRLEPGQSFEAAPLAQSLRADLPDYMIPEQFFCLTEFPKTPNDKIDRRRLASMLSEQIAVARPELPKDATPQELARILIAEATGKNDIDPHFNLFDQGLTSLQANWVTAELSRLTGQRHSVSMLFENPTLSGFLRGLAEKSGSDRKQNGPQTRQGKIDQNDGIAVIAMSGRFPGADTLDELWQMLVEGREGITAFTPEQDDPVAKKLWGDDPGYKRVRGMIRNPDMFDAGLFGINPNDAKAMDPQQRVFLELAWEAFEKAGYLAGHGDMRVGSFAGMGNNFYYHYNVSTHPDHIAMIGGVQTEIGREKDHIATIVSYKLNLKGPSLSIHTACSTALVAIDSACQALWSDQCDMAIAGGIELRTPQFSGQVHEPDGIFTGDGHCRPFSKDASGTMFSDSAGVLILKRLSDAEADGDTILAVIRGSATNHDGFEKQSYLAPSVAGQIDVIETAQRKGGISADTVSYIEAHGTGTLVGDPIEFEALRRVFERAGAHPRKCAIGSVKANLGHPTTAAGVVGVIKAVLAMQHRMIPPLANFTGINPNIDIHNSPFFIPEKPVEWVVDGHPRRAGISSFGFCGTNAHVVVEEYIPAVETTTTVPEDITVPIVISAQSDAALEQMQADISDHLVRVPEALEKTAYTLAAGRRRLAKSTILPARRRGGVVTIANPIRVPTPLSAGLAGFEGRIGFLFPGQGAQYTGMGQTLRDHEPVFREAFDECVSLMSDEMGEDLRGVMFGEVPLPKDAPPLINNTYYTQPSIFCLEYALARLWQSWGVEPDFVIGHSIGEFVGATIAGVFELSEGVKAIAARGRLVRDLPTGSMMSVRLSEGELTPLIPDTISLAAVNSPKLCVVAGRDSDIQALAQELDKRGIHQKLLHTSHAFHSFMMDPAVSPFRQVLDGLSPRTPSIPIISSVTGQTMADETALDLDYWAEHLRKPVRFASAVTRVLADGDPTLMIEVGPRTTLSSLSAQMLADRATQVAVPSLQGPESELDESQSVIAAYGRVLSECPYLADCGFFDPSQRRRIPLPTYPFQRKSYWLEPAWLPGGQAVATPTQTADEATASNTDDPFDVADIIGKLETILTEISGLDLTGMNPSSSFFELGLDSLLLTPLTFKARKSFGIRVSFRQLLRDISTPEALAQHIATGLKDEAKPTTPEVGKETDVPALPATTPAEMPLSTRQTLHTTADNGGEYSAVLAFGQRLDIPRLEACLEHMLKNHDALRARVNFASGNQSFSPEWQLDLRILKGQTNPPERQAPAPARRIDPNAPVLQAVYQEDGLGQSWLRLTLPSYLCDIWSMDLLIENLAKLYRDQAKARGSQSRDSFAEMVQSDISEQTSATRSPYWDRQIDQYSTRAIPAPTALSGTPNYAGCVIDRDDLQALRDLATQRKQSLVSVLMHRCAEAIHRHAPDAARLFAVTMAGQPFANAPQLVGQCANVTPVGFDPAMASDADIHEALTSAYENQQSSTAFWQSYPPTSFGSSLIRLTHIKRLTRQQTDFGIPFKDYWFDLAPDGQFAHQIILTEDQDKLYVDFCSFDGAFSEGLLNRIVGTIAASTPQLKTAPQAPEHANV